MEVSGVDINDEKTSNKYFYLRFTPYLNRKADKDKSPNKDYDTVTDTVIMSGITRSIKPFIPVYDPNYKIHNIEDDQVGAFEIADSSKGGLGSGFKIHGGPKGMWANSGWAGAGCMEVSGFTEMKKQIIKLARSKLADEASALKEIIDCKKLTVAVEAAEKPPVKETEPPPDL